MNTPNLPNLEPDSVREDIGYKQEYDPESGRQIAEHFRQLAEAHPAEHPHTEVPQVNGLYDETKLKPGMVMAGWGPVEGRDFIGSDQAFDDIVKYESSVPHEVRPFLAAREYARRQNEIRRLHQAIKQAEKDPIYANTLGNLDEQLEKAAKARMEWARHSRNKGWSDPSKLNKKPAA